MSYPSGSDRRTPGGLFAVSLAGVICSVIALLVARHWAATGERVAASVTGCAVWFPDTGLHRCDYHRSFHGESFIGRFPGGDWPDGHSVTLWMNPDDPMDVGLHKSVASPVVFAVFGLGLLLATGWLIGWTKRSGGDHAKWPAGARRRPRRALILGAVLGGAALTAVAAVPTSATVWRGAQVRGR